MSPLLALSGHPDGSAALSAFGAKADISRHLRRVLALYSSYYDESRTHLALEKDAPLQKLSRGTDSSSPRQFVLDCTIAMRGDDFRKPRLLRVPCDRGYE